MTVKLLLTVTLLNKIESIKRIATATTVVTKETWLLFGLNCWQSSRPSSEHIYMNTGSFLSSALWIFKSLMSHWLPAIQIFRLSNLIHIPLFKLLSISHVHSWYSDLSFPLWLFDVIECLDNFVCFSLSSRTSPFRNRSESFFSLSLPRKVCAFVSLRHENILQHYIDNAPRNRVAKFSPNCFFLPLWNISGQTKFKSSLTGLYSNDHLGNTQLKLSFFDWCISIPSSKKIVRRQSS